MSAPTAVLFACGLNRIRSPMAAGLLRRLHGSEMKVESCGLRVDPEALPDPFVAVVMDEVGVDMEVHAPQTFEDLADQPFDVIISLCAEAHDRAVAFARGRRVKVEYWPTIDPTLTFGSREVVLDAYRGVRRSLDEHIRERFPPAQTFGG